MPAYYGYPEFEGSVMFAMESFDKKNESDNEDGDQGDQ